VTSHMRAKLWLASSLQESLDIEQQSLKEVGGLLQPMGYQEVFGTVDSAAIELSDAMSDPLKENRSSLKDDAMSDPLKENRSSLKD